MESEVTQMVTEAYDSLWRKLQELISERVGMWRAMGVEKREKRVGDVVHLSCLLDGGRREASGR